MIDLAFLISAQRMNAYSLAVELERIRLVKRALLTALVFSQRTSGYSLDNLDVEQRHAFAAQGPPP